MLHQLHSLDRLFLDLETETVTMGVTPIYFYDPSGMEGGKFSYPALLAHLDRCIRSIPVLHGKLHRVTMDLDNPYLVEDPFYDVENHVRHHVLQNATDVKELSQEIMEFHERQLDTSRPLWEALVVSGVNIKTLPRNGFVLALKIHHAVADGMTVMDMTAKLHGLTPIGESAQLPSVRRVKSGGLLGLATRILSNNVRQSLQLVSPVLKVGPQLSLSTINHLYNRITKNASPLPITRFNSKVSNKRVWGYAMLPLDEMNKIRALLPSCTINHLVLTVVAGALRQYLADKNELPESTLRAIAPINVRQVKEQSNAGNQLSLCAIDLPVQIEDPLERLMAVISSSDQTKDTQKKLGTRNITDIVKNIPPAYLSGVSNLLGNASTVSLLAKMGNTVVTNVPGPTRELNLLGARLVNMSGAGPITDDVGLMHPVCSYNGMLNIAVTCCPEMMPDIKFYISCLYDSFNQLSETIEVRYAQAAKLPSALTCLPEDKTSTEQPTIAGTSDLSEVSKQAQPSESQVVVEQADTEPKTIVGAGDESELSKQAQPSESQVAVENAATEPKTIAGAGDKPELSKQAQPSESQVAVAKAGTEPKTTAASDKLKASTGAKTTTAASSKPKAAKKSKKVKKVKKAVASQD